jgi:tetratricopeptide (TPR) repeat protein
MKLFAVAFVVAVAATVSKGQQVSPQNQAGHELTAPGTRTLAELAHAPIDERIQTFERRLQASPDDGRLQAALISSYLQKLRESGDRVYLDRAARIVDRMIERDGGSFTAMRFQNEIDLQRHDFRAVAERALDMSKYAPSDPGVWGNLGDASMELGDYQQAPQAYSRMFALRPNLASYSRMAYWQFVTGDLQRAIALVQNAIDAGDAEPENVAWCWAELGDMQFKAGRLTEASNAYRAALRLFPGLHRASAGLAKVEFAQGDRQAAIADYERAQSIVPLVEYAAALEDLYGAIGKPAEAKKQRDLIRAIERLGAATNEKTNRNLALVLADRDQDVTVALALMQAEIPTRGDVYTWDALSWVLYKNGQLAEAEEAGAKALNLGTPEPLFYYHACKIALAAGDRQAAHAYSRNLLALNNKFDVAKSDITQEIIP